MIRSTTTPVLLPLLASLAALALLTGGADAQRPAHRSMGVAEFRPETRSLQCMLRVDPARLERSLSDVAEQKMILENPEAERVAAAYLRAALRMREADATPIEHEWRGMDLDPEWAWLYVEFPIPRETEGLEISNTLFFDLSDDQVNAMSVQVGERASTLTFTRDEPWRPLDLPAGPERDLTPIPETRTIGEGPVRMLLIPTHNCDWSIFKPFMERNAERYTMTAVTLPGMGGTNPPPMPLPADDTPWIDNAVKATRNLIGDLDLERPVILGYGLGGIVAYRLATEHPDAVGPIITLDAMPAMMLTKDPVPPEERKKMIDKVMARQFERATARQWEVELRKLAAAIVVGDERRRQLTDLFLQTPPAVGKQYLLQHMKVDLSDELGEIRSPTLAIASVNNLGTPRGIFPADIERNWKLLTDHAPDHFRLVFFRDTGPFITEERPERLDEVVAEFLGEVEASRE